MTYLINKTGYRICSYPSAYPIDDLTYSSYSYLDGVNYALRQIGLIAFKVNDKLGVLSSSGKIVVPCEYDGFGYIDGCHHNKIDIRKNGRFFLFDLQRQIILPSNYSIEKIISWNDNFICGMEGYQLLIFSALTGEKICTLKDTWFHSFDGDTCLVTQRLQNDGNSGKTIYYINAEGEKHLCKKQNVPIPQRVAHGHTTGFVRTCELSDGMIAVYDGKSWGFSSKDGRMVIPYQFEDCFDFSEGVAAVKKNGQWGYIDKTGLITIPFIFLSAKPFFNGLAVVDDGVEHNGMGSYIIDYQSVCQRDDRLDNLKQIGQFAFCRIKESESIFLRTTTPIASIGYSRVQLLATKDINGLRFSLEFITKVVHPKSSQVIITINKDDSVLWQIKGEQDSTPDVFNPNKAIVSFEHIIRQDEIKRFINKKLTISIVVDGFKENIPFELPSSRFLCICYAICPETLSIEEKNIVESMLMQQIEDKKETNKEEKERLKQKQELNDKLADCYRKIQTIDFEDLSNLKKFITKPASFSSVKEFIVIAQEMKIKHPFLKIINDKRRYLPEIMLKDIDEVLANQAFVAKHSLLSSISRKRTELSDDTKYYIKAIKDAISSELNEGSN